MVLQSDIKSLLDLYNTEEGNGDAPEHLEENEEPPKAQPTYKAPEPAPKIFASSQPAASSYSAQAPQQIPTYEEPTTQGYQSQQPARTQDSHYGGMNSVRPSEMKDEG